MCQGSPLSTGMAMAGFKRPRADDYFSVDYSTVLDQPSAGVPCENLVPKHQRRTEGGQPGLRLHGMVASQTPVSAKRSRNHYAPAPGLCHAHADSLNFATQTEAPPVIPVERLGCGGAHVSSLGACEDLQELPVDCPTSSSDDRAIAQMCLQDLLMRHAELQPDLASWPAMVGAGEPTASWLGGCRGNGEDGAEGPDDDGDDDHDEEEKENKLIAALCLQDLLASSQAEALGHETEAAMSHVSTGNCPGSELSGCHENQVEGADAGASSDLVGESFGGLFEDVSIDWDRAIAQVCLKDLQTSLGVPCEGFSSFTSCFVKGAGSSSCSQVDEVVEAVVDDNM